jgi:hypothetical protein
MPIEADMMLGEWATIGGAGGGISILGVGWQVRDAEAIAPCAIIVVLKLSRKQPGPHKVRLELQDYGGNLVAIDPPDGPGEMVIEGEVAIQGSEDPNLKTPLLGPFVANLPPFPLEAGKEYQWRLHVDGKTRAAWTLPFRTKGSSELPPGVILVPALGRPQG